MTAKPLSYSFPPIINSRCKVLILGSMPGVESLRQQQYYAHPRNAFWPIMAELCQFDLQLSYQQRCEQLLSNGIAVWDVLKACHRPGSLDQHIDNSTIEANDFKTLLESHPDIQHLFFNGAKAEQVFNKHVKMQLTNIESLKLNKLPSTSPAHAAMNLPTKTKVWQNAISAWL
jgi:hypoxanthine-DNA glycosylase